MSFQTFNEAFYKQQQQANTRKYFIFTRYIRANGNVINL
jgi:hypothetical protein